MTKKQQVQKSNLTQEAVTGLMLIDELARQDERQKIERYELPLFFEINKLTRAVIVVLELAEFGDKEKLPSALSRFIPIIGARRAKVWTMLQRPGFERLRDMVEPHVAPMIENILFGIQRAIDGDNGTYLRTLSTPEEITAIELEIEQFGRVNPPTLKKGRPIGMDNVTRYAGGWLHNAQLEGKTVESAMRDMQKAIEAKPANARTSTEKTVLFSIIESTDPLRWAYQCLDRYKRHLPKGKKPTT